MARIKIRTGRPPTIADIVKKYKIPDHDVRGVKQFVMSNWLPRFEEPVRDSRVFRGKTAGAFTTKSSSGRPLTVQWRKRDRRAKASGKKRTQGQKKR